MNPHKNSSDASLEPIFIRVVFSVLKCLNGAMLMVWQPIGPTTHWSENPLVRRPIGPKTHWSENPLVWRPIGPKKCHWSENHYSEKVCHWYDGSLVRKRPIGPKTHWSEDPLVQKNVIGPKKCHWSENSGFKRHGIFFASGWCDRQDWSRNLIGIEKLIFHRYAYRIVD